MTQRPKNLDADCGNCLLFGALQAVPDGMVLLDASGRIVHLNAVAIRLLDLEGESFAGAAFPERISHRGLRAFWAAAAAEEGPVSGEVGATDGRTLRVSVSPCRSASGEPMGHLLMLRDISQEKRIQVDLSQDVARQVSAMAGGALEPPDDQPLTRREREILALVAAGLTNPAIADRLNVSVNTVASHLKNLYGKIQVRSRSEATAWAVRHGIGSSRR